MIRAAYSFFKKYNKNKDGATAVEFALVGFPFLLMLFGVMEAGRSVWIMNSVQYAVEETSRYAALNSDVGNNEFQTYAASKLSGMRVPSSPLQITSSQLTSNGVDFVEVAGSFEISTMISGLIPGDFGNFNYSTSVRTPVIN